MNNRDFTNYLKAIAILMVCLNHFINSYMTNSLSGYAGGFIALFFILSGYGTYHSLKNQSERPFIELLMFFLKKRFMRIYPLFWIWCVLHGFKNGILGFFALDFIHPKSPWFVPAIMQCYLVSPFLFIFSKRIQLKYGFLIISSLIILLNILLFWGDFSPLRTIGYRKIFLLHIFLFYLGYVLAQIKKKTIYPMHYVIISFLLLIFFIQETTPQAFLSFQGKEYLFPLLFSLSVFFLCLTAFSSNIVLPFKNLMNFIGIHSYSIYLFHGISFKILSEVGIIHKQNTHLSGAIIWLLSMPLFLIALAALETVVDEFVFGKRKLKNALETYLSKLPTHL